MKVRRNRYPVRPMTIEYSVSMQVVAELTGMDGFGTDSEWRNPRPALGGRVSSETANFSQKDIPRSCECRIDIPDCPLSAGRQPDL